MERGGNGRKQREEKVEISMDYNEERGGMERVWNDLQRTRLSRCLMSWLLAHPLPPIPTP
jgi:hypothetical protein